MIAVAAGANAMALRADGTVLVWDVNGFRTDAPAGLDGVVGISAGLLGHQLAVKSDGTVVAWGSNTYGQTSVPSGLSGVVAVAAGSGTAWR